MRTLCTLEQSANGSRTAVRVSERTADRHWRSFVLPRRRALGRTTGNIRQYRREACNGFDKVGTAGIDLSGDFLCDFLQSLNQNRQAQIVQRPVQNQRVGGQLEAVDGKQNQLGEQVGEGISPSRKRAIIVSMDGNGDAEFELGRGQHRP
ncbi:MAG: hypothetical protein MZV65_38515 [Chromatiales bacterium]|nr:hypothetical protein [Chromatiales bacterium]